MAEASRRNVCRHGDGPSRRRAIREGRSGWNRASEKFNELIDRNICLPNDSPECTGVEFVVIGDDKLYKGIRMFENDMTTSLTDDHKADPLEERRSPRGRIF